MVGTSKDYSGRQLDLLALQGAIARQGVLVSPDKLDITAVSSNGGYAVTGIAKCIQRFVKLLFTDKGSVRFDPDAGSQLMQAVRNGTVYSTSVAQTLFALASAYAQSTMRAEDAQDGLYGAVPADERLASASLDNVVVDEKKSEIRFSVSIRTEAGTTATYIIPVASGV